MTVPVGQSARPAPRPYWKLEFPDQGEECRSTNAAHLVEEFESHLLAAVERRLRADVPVVQYLSGGIDSSIVAAMASKALGRPIPTFTIQVPHPHLDETAPAALVADYLGSKPVVIRCDDRAVTTTYPRLVWAGEAPVVDTSAAGLLLLAECVHQHGYKVALTGEGSDEFLAGYSWFKFHEVLRALDAIPGLPIGSWLRRLYLRVLGGSHTHAYQQRLHRAAGGMHGFHEVYQLMSLSRRRFYSADTLAALADHVPYADLSPDLDRLRRWHPFHRGLYWGIRIHLPGHLLSLKGDRIAMHSSVETRYPFLDERVFAFLAKLHPRWKLRGFWDKYVLRLLGQRWLPRAIAWRPKAMFMAPFDCFFTQASTPLVEQLLSEESLRRTGYFDVGGVRHWMTRFRSLPRLSHLRTSVEMGLVAVVATQMWHHTFVDASLADAPAYRPNSDTAALSTSFFSGSKNDLTSAARRMEET
jgi:asparagine synthase (glutamine-hydrolysing)